MNCIQENYMWLVFGKNGSQACIFRCVGLGSVRVISMEISSIALAVQSEILL